MSGQDTSNDTDTISRSDSKTREPSLYKVILLNDDFTPMDFVVELIMKHFRKSLQEATQIMLNVHYQGQGLCGLYPRDIAETKVFEVNSHARQSGHPLKCLMEQN
ncbi:MAG: ATP-dependent Clp protease adapter ClpS [Magnetococcales bacterium]|nr:ATP-dependent Clp protease adapter ClpS [Magnetococcales bacterium]MBF0421063.1 ATP-dependent Clp protease adapter ClpS [Magnetococcales bacterium]